MSVPQKSLFLFGKKISDFILALDKLKYFYIFRKLVVVEKVMQLVEGPRQRQSLLWRERAEQIGLEAYGNRDDLIVDAPTLAGERDLGQPAIACIFCLLDDPGGLQTGTVTLILSVSGVSAFETDRTY